MKWNLFSKLALMIQQTQETFWRLQPEFIYSCLMTAVKYFLMAFLV